MIRDLPEHTSLALSLRRLMIKTCDQIEESTCKKLEAWFSPGEFTGMLEWTLYVKPRDIQHCPVPVLKFWADSGGFPVYFPEECSYPRAVELETRFKCALEDEETIVMFKSLCILVPQKDTTVYEFVEGKVQGSTHQLHASERLQSLDAVAA